MLAAVFLSLDIANLYFAKRVLQRQANMAALDGARVVSGCSTDGLPLISDIEAAIGQSLVRNQFSTSEDHSSQVTSGNVVVVNGLRFLQIAEAESGGTVNATAVGVTLRRPFPDAFLPFLRPAGQQFLTAYAVAEQAALGSFYIGTTLASLDDGLANQLLGGLLCGLGDDSCVEDVINLDLADSNSGLADVGVSLGDLATALDLSVQDLSDPLNLDLETPLPDFIDGLVDALGDGVSDTVRTLLIELAASVDGNAATIVLGDLLNVIGPIAADVPIVDLYNLLLAVGAAAQGDDDGNISPIAVPVDVSIPGTIDLATFVQVLDPPEFSGMGRAGIAEASSAQVTVQTRIEAGDLITGLTSLIEGIINGALGLLNLVGITSDVDALPNLNIGVDVTVNEAHGYLDNLQCPRGIDGQNMPIAELSAETSIASVTVGTFSGSAASAPDLEDSGSSSEIPLATVTIDATGACVGVKVGATCIGIPLNLGSTQLSLSLGLSSVGVGGGAPVNLSPVTDFTLDDGGTGWVYTADGAPNAPPSAYNPQTVGSQVNVSLDLELLSEEQGSGLVGLLGSLVSQIVNAVALVLDPLIDLVNGLADSVINPLLSTLGLSTGQATVTMNTVQAGQPRLVSVTVAPAVLSD